MATREMEAGAARIISERQLVRLKIDSLKFDKSNPNKLTDEQMQALHKSMQRFGYLTPIVVDQDNQIADGEHRALVYKQHGLKEIPAFKVNLKTDAERRLLRQTMNKLRGEHDRELDANELVTIFQAGQLDDLTQLIAQDKEDLQRLMLRYHPALDFVTPENEAEIDKLIDDELRRKVPDTKLGDLYQLGDHRLVCGDCTDRRLVDKLMAGSYATATITDPPYSVGYEDLEREPGRITRKQKGDTYVDAKDAATLLNGFIAILPSDTLIMTYAFNRHFHELAAATAREWEMLYECIWLKHHFAFIIGRNYQPKHEPILIFRRKAPKAPATSNVPAYQSTVFEYDKPISNPIHATPKPLRLIADLIEFHSNGHDAIYDPFLGGGTTLIACEKTGRKCYGIEIDPHYCDVIIKRWEMYTGKKAVKLSS